jgi:uncharacterized membrane protein
MSALIYILISGIFITIEGNSSFILEHQFQKFIAIELFEIFSALNCISPIIKSEDSSKICRFLEVFQK